MITVQHRNGWCVALDKQSREYEDNVATLCGHVVICPWGISDTKPPTCEECLVKMRGES